MEAFPAIACLIGLFIIIFGSIGQKKMAACSLALFYLLSFLLTGKPTDVFSGLCWSASLFMLMQQSRP